jgi:hypothetical protein
VKSLEDYDEESAMIEVPESSTAPVTGEKRQREDDEDDEESNNNEPSADTETETRTLSTGATPSPSAPASGNYASTNGNAVMNNIASVVANINQDALYIGDLQWVCKCTVWDFWLHSFLHMFP